MAKRVICSNKQIAAQRQIHAAIKHFYAGGFECAITLCSAAEGQMPEPQPETYLFGILKNRSCELTNINEKDDFNYASNWLKHTTGPSYVEIEEFEVKIWLYRAISKYIAVYGIGTEPMKALFPWAGKNI